MSILSVRIFFLFWNISSSDWLKFLIDSQSSQKNALNWTKERKEKKERKKNFDKVVSYFGFFKVLFLLQSYTSSRLYLTKESSPTKGLFNKVLSSKVFSKFFQSLKVWIKHFVFVFCFSLLFWMKKQSILIVGSINVSIYSSFILTFKVLSFKVMFHKALFDEKEQSGVWKSSVYSIFTLKKPLKRIFC